MVSTISPQSSLDLDTDQVEIIDETLKQLHRHLTKHYLRQLQDSASNLGSRDTSHDNTSNRQSTHAFNTSDIYKHTTTSPENKLTDQTHLNTSSQTPLQISKKTHLFGYRCFITLPTQHNKILQELNLNGLCQYSNSHQAYIFKNSNGIVNCSYILVFLMQSTCYVIAPNTYQWYRFNTNEILESHKLGLCNDQLTNMVPIPPAETPEINAFTTITRLTFLQTQNEQVSNTCTQPMYIALTLANLNTNS